MPSLPIASLYTEKSNKGGVVRAQLASCASARAQVGAAMASEGKRRGRGEKGEGREGEGR